ncbi:MAG: FCD domain-containing protein [Desulfobacterales bacterium]
MVLRKIGRRKLSDAVVEELTRLLERGEWKPGERLPREAELASRLGVSRNTLREALYSLTLAGILEPRQGAGTFVRGGPRPGFPCVSPPPRVEGAEGAAALAETRAILELASARAAAGNSRAAVWKGLHRRCAAMDEALRGGGPEAFLEQDAAFHQALAGAAGNPFMAHLLGIVRALIAPLVMEAVRLRPEALAPFQADHERLVEAVAAGDPKAAAAAMARHMARVREAIGAPPEDEPACRPMPRLCCSRS